MEKRTLLAVVLSVVVISVFYTVQALFFMPQEPAGQEPAPVEQPLISETTGSPPPALTVDTTQEPAEPGDTAEAAPIEEQWVTINTELAEIILSNTGGDMISYKLKNHQDGSEPVEMILPGDREPHAFTIAFGDMKAEPVQSLFHVNRLSSTSVEFYRDFAVGANGGEAGQFRLTKRYDFIPDEYMFELTVTVDGGNSVPSINFSGAAYTLAFGPQIGPSFEKLDQRYEYRQYLTLTNGKKRQEKVNSNGPTVINSRATWAAIAGKYFTFIAIPESAQYEMAFSTAPEAGLSDASRFFMVRPPLNSSRTTDTYRFYLGPKSQNDLAIYDNANNAYKLRDLQLSDIASTSGFLAPLEFVLKWLLQLFYRIIPNYGVAIILLTLLVKILLFPLTKKGSESTLRMQTLSPKIQEIQTKYKDNPNKMNAEMAELYKKEGYNPMSGCLPMLIQFPIIFAMYNLFNTHFDLRGAMFIPGWIPDLSRPEFVYSFAPFRLPILGWSEIRLLPFIYLASQLLYGKVTQTLDQKANTQMKLMLYVMPIVFFFILYDVPSGLLLYWILSNLLTLVQQLTINKYLAKRKAQIAAEQAPQQVIVPKKKKKR
ncbi:membrane protein insertase YidC [Breznakiella homolactica]|uniref:Membrane protein insertase YidC n=1 Tax=Breznakiella homolactica TaxID=2798577 RepID=A0A7T7XPU7_9SPIR|nr:membrane protein insertase YidC [Breznakiella homolactica]QQO10290.1 membrane protein insertase YidC [Breznakiella homolactica]